MDAVVFDMGGVILEWDPVTLYERVLGLDRAQAHALVDEIDLYAWNARLDAGERIAVVLPHWQQVHPHRRREIAWLHDRWPASVVRIHHETVALIERVRATGVVVAGLTNASDEHMPHARRLAPVLDRLDPLVVSGAEGVAKPDPEIYRRLLARLDAPAQRTVLVDDRADNCAAAVAQGMEAVQFADAAQAATALVELGVLPSQLAAPGGRETSRAS